MEDQNVKDVKDVKDVNGKKGMKKYLIVIIAAVILVMSYFYFGIFTIQPVSGIPDGMSVVWKRWGTENNFFESPDSLSLRIFDNKVTEMGRSMATAAFLKNNNRIIIKLPYLKIFYLLSTGGKEYK